MFRAYVLLSRCCPHTRHERYNHRCSSESHTQWHRVSHTYSTVGCGTWQVLSTQCILFLQFLESLGWVWLLSYRDESKRHWTERRGMGKIKGGNYANVQFISVRLCQELHDDSSGWVDQVVQNQKQEPNKFVREVFYLTAGTVAKATKWGGMFLCSDADEKTQQPAAAFWTAERKTAGTPSFTQHWLAE